MNKKSSTKQVPDSLIIKNSIRYDVPLDIIMSVIEIESSDDANARRYEKHLDKNDSDTPGVDDGNKEDDASYGPMQILGATARTLGFVGDFDGLFNPACGIKFGTKYLRWCFSHYGEISNYDERWKFAVAAYNAGRGDINKMLLKARRKESEFEKKTINISMPGKWQLWNYSSHLLESVTGSASKYTLNYIEKLNKLQKKYREFMETDEDFIGKVIAHINYTIDINRKLVAIVPGLKTMYSALPEYVIKYRRP